MLESQLQLVPLTKFQSFSHFRNERTIRPLCLPSPALNTDADNYGKPVVATVAGWGRIGSNGEQSNFLRYVQLEVLKNPDCNTKFSPSLGGIQSVHLCAYAKGKC